MYKLNIREVEVGRWIFLGSLILISLPILAQLYFIMGVATIDMSLSKKLYLLVLILDVLLAIGTGFGSLNARWIISVRLVMALVALPVLFYFKMAAGKANLTLDAFLLVFDMGAVAVIYYVLNWERRAVAFFVAQQHRYFNVPVEFFEGDEPSVINLPKQAQGAADAAVESEEDLVDFINEMYEDEDEDEDEEATASGEDRTSEETEEKEKVAENSFPDEGTEIEHEDAPVAEQNEKEQQQAADQAQEDKEKDSADETVENSSNPFVKMKLKLWRKDQKKKKEGEEGAQKEGSSDSIEGDESWLLDDYDIDDGFMHDE